MCSSIALTTGICINVYIQCKYNGLYEWYNLELFVLYGTDQDQNQTEHNKLNDSWRKVWPTKLNLVATTQNNFNLSSFSSDQIVYRRERQIRHGECYFHMWYSVSLCNLTISQYNTLNYLLTAWTFKAIWTQKHRDIHCLCVNSLSKRVSIASMDFTRFQIVSWNPSMKLEINCAFISSSLNCISNTDMLQNKFPVTILMLFKGWEFLTRSCNAQCLFYPAFLLLASPPACVESLSIS